MQYEDPNTFTDLKEVISRKREISIKYNYPLKNPVIKKHKVKGCKLTTAQLLEIIGQDYKEIYEEDENTMKYEDELTEEEKKEIYSSGKYGIWGHSLEDLQLVAVIFNKKTNCYELTVDS